MGYLTYYDRMKPLRIVNKHYWPYCILHLRLREPKDLLFFLEMHSGGIVKENITQLDNLMDILQSGTLARRFGLRIDHRFLSWINKDV